MVWRNRACIIKDQKPQYSIQYNSIQLKIKYNFTIKLIQKNEINILY